MPASTDDLKKLIPLRKFAKAGVYSAAYLSQLVQRKKLKAQKIGRNFYTTKEWFDEYLSLHARDHKQDGYAAAAPFLAPARRDFFAKYRASAILALVFVAFIFGVWYLGKGRVAGVSESASSTATNIDGFITDFH